MKYYVLNGAKKYDNAQKLVKLYGINLRKIWK